MTIALPTAPAIMEFTPRIVSSRSELRSVLSANVQRRIRKGSRYAIDFVTEPMDHETALLWRGLETETDTVSIQVPQPGATIGSIGTPRVNGAGQAGMTLNVDGLNVGAVVKKGWLLTVVTSSRNYLYEASANATANGSGQIAIPLMTMLRYPPSDNDVVKIADPVIEGFASVSEGAWKTDGSGYRTLSFTIEER